MHRLIFLLFFAMIVFQPALSGVLVLAVPSEPMLSSEMSVSSSAFLDSADHAAACFSHVEAASPGAPSGCSSGQPCGLCNLCQACHLAVMAQGQMAAPGHIAIRPSFPSVVSGYFSAERAQSFKPPIL